MEFNKGKFIVLRYGENEALKNETEYFSGDFEEIIERKESLRDLGVQLTDDGGFGEQIEKVCKKARQKSGWIFRTFYSRNTQFLKQVFKSLVQPHIDYCSQLWTPLEGPNLEKVEKGLFQEDSGAKRNELLAEAGEVGHELGAEKAGEIPDDICVESNPWGGSQLWNNLDRM